MADTIVLTLPASQGYRSVASLVLGGIGSRLDLPYERVDDLQLAVLSVLDSTTGEAVTIELEAGAGSLAVAIGPVDEGVGADRALGKVLERLVSGTAEMRRDGRAWVRLELTPSERAAQR